MFSKKSTKEVAAPTFIFQEGENISTDLDKAWHGIHYCLTKTSYAGSFPLNFIVLSGESIGDIDVGYGPARYFNRDLAQEIYTQVFLISQEKLKANYNPEKMKALEIYPDIWDPNSDDEFDYLNEKMEKLKIFLENCVENKLGMIVYFC